MISEVKLLRSKISAANQEIVRTLDDTRYHLKSSVLCLNELRFISNSLQEPIEAASNQYVALQSDESINPSTLKELEGCIRDLAHAMSLVDYELENFTQW